MANMARALTMIWLGAGLAGGCAAPVDLPPMPSYDATALGSVTLKAVVIAGDGAIPAFDNAVDRMSAYLSDTARIPAENIQRLSSAPAVVARPGVRTASRDRILSSIGAMRPGPGQGCLVFATSHGARGRGLVLAAAGETLDPDALDRSLAAGCGNAPTVVVMSGCYSGIFVQPPMARANRIILTASRADRVSFGCGARNELTDYDRCLLASLAGGTWRDAGARIATCVAAQERRGRFPPSEPQAWYGAAVAAMPLPKPANDLAN